LPFSLLPAAQRRRFWIERIPVGRGRRTRRDRMVGRGRRTRRNRTGACGARALPKTEQPGACGGQSLPRKTGKTARVSGPASRSLFPTNGRAIRACFYRRNSFSLRVQALWLRLPQLPYLSMVHTRCRACMRDGQIQGVEEKDHFVELLHGRYFVVPLQSITIFTCDTAAMRHVHLPSILQMNMGTHRRQSFPSRRVD
jgi:hypothetical protein